MAISYNFIHIYVYPYAYLYLSILIIISIYLLYAASKQQSSMQHKASAIKNKSLMIGTFYTTGDMLQWWLRWTNEL